MPGALGDSINAFQSKKIVGLQKTSPLNAIDASLIEVNMTTPITVIGFTKSDTEKIRKVYPYIPFIETPKGTIAQLPDAGPMYELAPIVGAMASKNLPEDVVYNIVKSYYGRLVGSRGVLPGGEGVESHSRPLQIRARRRRSPCPCRNGPLRQRKGNQRAQEIHPS